MYKKIILIFFTLIIAFSAAVYFLYTDKINTPLTSPILKEGRALAENLWFPKVLGATFTPGPEITARSAFFIDSINGDVLYSKNPQERLPIASLTKVMTVLIALEHKNMTDKFLVSHRAADFEPDKMFLIGGEELTLKELLYGVFLISANDATEVIAEDTTGNREEFINLMNAKVKELGMKDSYFANPTGLDEDSGNTYLPTESEGKVLRAQSTPVPDYVRAGSYSSAYDLAILTRYLIRHYPEVIQISSSPYVYISSKARNSSSAYLEQNLEHQAYEMYTGINLLTTYPGVLGFKTGYTPEAGYTLITLAQKNGKEIIGVLLNSESRREEAKLLLDYSFGKLGI